MALREQRRRVLSKAPLSCTFIDLFGRLLGNGTERFEALGDQPGRSVKRTWLQ